MKLLFDCCTIPKERKMKRWRSFKKFRRKKKHCKLFADCCCGTGSFNILFYFLFRSSSSFFLLFFCKFIIIYWFQSVHNPSSSRRMLISILPVRSAAGSRSTPSFPLSLLLRFGIPVVVASASATALSTRRRRRRRRWWRRRLRRWSEAIFRTGRTAVISSGTAVSGRCRRTASAAARFHTLLPLALDFAILHFLRKKKRQTERERERKWSKLFVSIFRRSR